MSKCYSRRSFLKSSLSAASFAAMAGVSSGPFVLAQQSPGDKLRVAVIGAANMGGYSVDCALKENLVALVDVDHKNIAKVMSEKVKDTAKPRIFYDYRKMLDECHKDLDVVLIATPDHNHAPAAIRAINYGKHVFCQKPLAHNIAECYALAKAARKHKVLTQMGNQGYCGEAIRRVAEYVAAGAIGEVIETHTLLDRNFGGTGGRPPSKPVPDGLHWDEWLGPAPYRDYHEGLHPFSWRDWKAFGTGTIGDMACHRLCYPFMALRLWEVKKFTVECINTKNGSDEKYPQDNIVCYHIPARDNFPACKCYVYDHKDLRPEVMKELEKKYEIKWSEATLFVGTKGYLNNHSRIIPESEHQKFPVPPKTLVRPKAGGPIEDLYACIRTGGTPVSNFIDAAGPLTAMALTGHLAQYAGIGAKIEWNVKKMKCTNMREINKFVRREYRKGWEV
ncbi:MAG: Gfo/Idh/MocA family oxidoreductase [Kiritimatiellae bacterium]|nr:Gfo/Idh/MocA family oxidoreductase [Kiritimatiellia bacterium]